MTYQIDIIVCISASKAQDLASNRIEIDFRCYRALQRWVFVATSEKA